MSINFAVALGAVAAGFGAVPGVAVCASNGEAETRPSATRIAIVSLFTGGSL